jgi:acetolactate synthase-1/2/3 large subunit
LTNTKTTVSDVLMRLLAERGVDFLFANAGTDFAPVIESLAKAQALGHAAPRPIAVPHEAVAVAMAHGYYLLTGRPQAVMVHVTVGTANALCNLINLSRAQIPVIMMAGRTPLVEEGLAGARNRAIQWAQESFDQAAMLREYVKWDYELKTGVQLEDVVNRAFQIAVSEPAGPIYLTLPREVLARDAAESGERGRKPVATTPFAPSPDHVDEIADLIRNAERPLIVTSGAGFGDMGIGALAETYAIPVIHHAPQYAALAAGSPMNFGVGPSPLLAEADVVLVIECDVPWIPQLEPLRPECRVVHIGVDPLFEAYPFRAFQTDLALRSSAELAVTALSDALGKPSGAFSDRIEARSTRLAVTHKAQRDALEASLRPEAGLTSALVTRTLSRICGEETLYVSDYSFQLQHIEGVGPGRLIGMSPAGGLGPGMGIALGAKLADRDRMLVVGVGDGTYFFSEALACHHLARAENLPFLTIIFNNRRWNAVRNAVQSMYPRGYALTSNQPPLIGLEPSPNFEKVVEACDGLGLRVDRIEDLEPVLRRAVSAVKGGQQAVVNVLVS